MDPGCQYAAGYNGFGDVGDMDLGDDEGATWRHSLPKIKLSWLNFGVEEASGS
jgi:hypothetical protein